MKNSTMPAVPEQKLDRATSDADRGMIVYKTIPGLSKREYIAAMAMQGYCSNTELSKLTTADIANWAVKQADDLLAELEKPTA